jgi:hypothetical protein
LISVLYFSRKRAAMIALFAFSTASEFPANPIARITVSWGEPFVQDLARLRPGKV